MYLQTCHLEYRYHAGIILLLFFTVFFVFFVLQGLVKICKKYMEANNFLFLICSLEK